MLIICSAIIFTGIIFLGIYFGICPRSIDFKGTIVNIENTNDYIMLRIHQNESSEYTVLADVHTDVYYCHHEEDIYLGELDIGDEIQGSYKKCFSENHYAESIMVKYVHED